MSDALPMSADFPSMGSSWPKHVINCSGSAGRQTVKAGSGKGEPTDRKGSPRSAVLIRNGDGPKPITAKRMYKPNASESAATLRNVRIMPKAGNNFAGGRNDSQR